MAEQEPAPDLFDLKMLPAWATESPNENRFADFAGEVEERRGPRNRQGDDRRERGPRPPRRNEPRREGRDRERRPAPRGRAPEPPPRRREEIYAPPPAVEVRFLPDPRALENVLAQIKGGHLAYSVFSLARMFLEKPERYDVRLTSQEKSLFQMGENGAVATDRNLLETGAFTRELENFYRTEVTQSEPIKGNFTSVARDRVSGTLLGPTNHHAYQQKLRALYEQRYSRRMSFPDFQRQIEIVNDPEVVERWKEEARSLTTYTTVKEEPPQTFASAADTERHFRQTYLGTLVREAAEFTVDGVVSRRLPDRALARLIENSWAQEARSPTRMMQELIAAFPRVGLHIFRHRKGMLFVGAVRPRPISHDSASLSPSISSLLTTLSTASGISRKHLLEKMMPAEEGAAAEPNELERKKLTIASDLRWLVSEGHVIEFNDGTLDLARSKTPPPPGAKARADTPNEQKTPPAAQEEPAADIAAEVPAPQVETASPEAAPSHESAPNESTSDGDAPAVS